ncbi:MAG: globin [Dehalococcoidia bacterium]
MAETLFERVGGRGGVRRVVADFYRRVEADDGLRPVYPEDLTPGREKLTLFMEQWLGGDAVYSELYGHPRLRMRHFPFVIGQRHAGRWLRHMREAMLANGVPEADIRVIFERLGPLAHHMVNEGQDVPREALGDVRLE